MINRLDLKVMWGSDELWVSDAIKAMHKQARFKLLLAKAPLIYSKWPHVAQIKTNSGQLQFILKRSLDNIQLTSDQTCLLVHGAEGSALISLYPRCTSWLSDINH